MMPLKRYLLVPLHRYRKEGERLLTIQIHSTPTTSRRELAKTIRLTLRLFDLTLNLFSLLNRLKNLLQVSAPIERD